MRPLSASVFADGTRVFATQRTAPRQNDARAAAQYDAAVQGIYDTIHGRPIGARFLDLLQRVPHPIVIVPTTARDNAYAGAVDVVASFPARDPVRDGTGRPHRNWVGTGSGSMVRVLFNPRPLGDASPQIILLHELTHAWRQAHGRIRGLPMTIAMPGARPAEDFAFNNWEEWLAILIQNIWSSEGGERSLRAFHTTRGVFGAMVISDYPNPFGAAAPMAAEDFARRYAGAFDTFRREEPQLFALLRTSTAHFNPLRFVPA